MLLSLQYLFQNLFRNYRRTLLTCAAVALPITILVLTSAVIDGLHRFLDDSSRRLRLVITHKTSIINPLPAGHRPKIESLDPSRERITAVCGFRWLGGRIQNDPRPISVTAGDVDTFPLAFSEYKLVGDALGAWKRDRQAIVIGRATAAQFGWKVGDRITVLPSGPPYVPIPFHIVALSPPDLVDTISSFCRRDYVEEIVRESGWRADLVSFIFVKCASQSDLAYFGAEIDRLFANTPDETFTQDEKTFMNQFVQQQFNLPRNLSILAALTIFVAVLAAANTMSMNFRDRLSEYATLRAIGFRNRVVFGMIQSESMAVCALGGLVGALGPFVAFTYTPLRNWRVPLIMTMDIRPAVCAYAIGVALLIGVLAALWPAWLAARLRVVEAFRLLE